MQPSAATPTTTPADTHSHQSVASRQDTLPHASTPPPPPTSCTCVLSQQVEFILEPNSSQAQHDDSTRSPDTTDPRFSPKHSVQSRGTCSTFQRYRSCRNDQTIADLRSKPRRTVRPCLRIVRMQMSCLYATLTALVYKERLRRWPLLMKLGRYRGLVRLSFVRRT